MRKSMFRLFALMLTLCLSASVMAQKVSKQTYVYAVKGADTLRLDKYAAVANKSDTVSKPVVLFAFGGGFTGGNRADKRYVPFFMQLVRNGFTVVSFDYRTTLKNAQPAELGTLEGFSAALSGAVGAAVEDCMTATAFVIKQSKTWKVDPQRIVACGSSAGAITVLQAEYMLCNGSDVSNVLPQGFNYAGVVSFAGAIMSAGEPQWQMKPCPIMLFHGDADRRVPFDKAVVNGMGLYGSNCIMNTLSAKGWPCCFYKAFGAGHEMAVTPMQDNKDDVIGFLRQMVLDKKPYIITTTRAVPGLSGYKTDFTLDDYINENMKP